MSTIKETIPFNYDDIYSAVKQKFSDKGYDVQEGSNTMQIVSAMSYLISMLNANTAININENVLTLARKRNNVLQDSRILGYEPGNKVSYQYYLTLKFTPLTDENGNYLPTSFNIPRYAKFTANSLNYYYMGELIRLRNITEPYEMKLLVKEGKLIKASEDEALTVKIGNVFENGSNVTQYYIDIPYSDVEEDGIDVSITYYDNNANLIEKEIWTRFNRFQIDIDTILVKQFFRLNVIEYDMPRIYLKLPNTGKDLELGSIVYLNILTTSGTNGEMKELPKTDEINCEIIDYALKLQGTDVESIESIKYNAPLFYNSANRAVTKNDYISICNRITAIDKTFVWDGNDEFPEKEGIIWFSFIPQSRIRKFDSDIYRTIFKLELENDKVNWFLEEAEIVGSNESIFNVLNNYKIPTLTLLHRHPIYMDITLNVEVLKYDISVSETQTNSYIFEVIDNYFYLADMYNTTLENFETELFLSNIIKRVDNVLSDLTGVNMTLVSNIKLNTKYISNEYIDKVSGIREKKIIIPLGLPYVNLFDNQGNLIIEHLPDITSKTFHLESKLAVDFSGLTGNELNSELITAPIKLYEINPSTLEYESIGVIGEYKIFNRLYIIVDLFINNILTEEMVDNSILDIKYYNSNIKFVKNTLPRLNTVNFI